MARITIFGAGAMGTLYGARLASAGHAITMVARGARRDAIEREGLRVRRREATETITVRTAVVERIEDGSADWVLVLVRAQQVSAVLPLLAAHAIDVVMMVNVASGYRAWREALGAKLVVGFPGATGRFAEDGALEWEIAPRLVQPTVIGEPSGAPTPRVRAFAAMLREAAFPTQIRSDMDSWQRTHAAWMTPFMLTAAAAHEDADAFATKPSVRRWVDAMRESLSALHARGARPTPASIRMLAAMPPALLVAAIRAVLLASRPLRSYLLATGTASAEEGRALAVEMLEEAKESDSALPVLRSLMKAAE